MSDGKTRWTLCERREMKLQIDNQKTDENTISPSTIYSPQMKKDGYSSLPENKRKKDGISIGGIGSC